MSTGTDKRQMIALARGHLSTVHLETGETVRINHTGCPAGEDTKKRLYITRPVETRGDVILVYCHNCAAGTGFSTKDGWASRPRTSCSTAIILPDREDIDQEFWDSLEEQMDIDYNRWSDEAKLFLAIGNVTPAMAYNLGWRFLPSANGLLIPLWDFDSRHVGYQMRNLISSPKYLTYYRDRAEKGTGFYWHGITCGHDHIVITEDALSAAHVFMAYDGSVGTFALGSSNVSTDVLHTLVRYTSKRPKPKFHVCLDNDSDTIVKHAQSIASRLRLMGCYVETLTDTPDPKHWSSDEVRSRIV